MRGGRASRATSSPTLPVPLGAIVADKYRLERILGAGGMGCVVEATHLDLEQRVALKFLLETKRDDAESTARFNREARAAAALASDHVARVLDTGTLPSGEPFIVMEYLEGVNLEERLKKDGKLSPEETVSLFAQACDALSEAHSLGIVHRDIKPTNIFLARRPNGRSVVKVLDFGISKSRYDRGALEDLTGSATILGTPHYMAPEQMTSTKDAEAPADVWALGVCMYKCLAGRLPFEEAMTLMELGAFVLAQDAPPIHTVAPNVPGSIAAIVMQCLQRDPLLRFTDAGDLLRVLDGTGLAMNTGSNPAMPRPTPSSAPTVAVAGRVVGVGIGVGPDSVLDEASTPDLDETRAAPPPVAPPTPPEARPLPVGAYMATPGSGSAMPMPMPMPLPMSMFTETAFGSPHRLSAPPITQQQQQQPVDPSARFRPFLLGLVAAIVIASVVLAVRAGSKDEPTTPTTTPTTPTSAVDTASSTATATTTAAAATPTVILVAPPPLSATTLPTADPAAPRASTTPPKKRVITPPHPHTEPPPTATAAPNQR